MGGEVDYTADRFQVVVHLGADEWSVGPAYFDESRAHRRAGEFTRDLDPYGYAYVKEVSGAV